MRSRGIRHLYYALEREGAKTVANVSSTQSMIFHRAAVRAATPLDGIAD